jgi:hypothetical protein
LFLQEKKIRGAHSHFWAGEAIKLEFKDSKNSKARNLPANESKAELYALSFACGNQPAGERAFFGGAHVKTCVFVCGNQPETKNRGGAPNGQAQQIERAGVHHSK